MDFYIFIKVKRGGGVALVHVYMYVLQNPWMDIYQTW